MAAVNGSGDLAQHAEVGLHELARPFAGNRAGHHRPLSITDAVQKPRQNALR
jgi:hypothetical protein